MVLIAILIVWCCRSVRTAEQRRRRCGDSTRTRPTATPAACAASARMAHMSARIGPQGAAAHAHVTHNDCSMSAAGRDGCDAHALVAGNQTVQTHASWGNSLCSIEGKPRNCGLCRAIEVPGAVHAGHEGREGLQMLVSEQQKLSPTELNVRCTYSEHRCCTKNPTQGTGPNP